MLPLKENKPNILLVLSTPFSRVGTSISTAIMPSMPYGGASAYHQAPTGYAYDRTFEQPRDLNSAYYGSYGTRSTHEMSGTVRLPDPYNSQKYATSNHWNPSRFPQGPSSAPFVPSARADDRWSNADHVDAHRRHNNAYYNEQRKRDEKPVGGVSATLDYEMDQMTDFVMEMAAGMYDLFASRICIADIDLAKSIKQSAIPPKPQFRKWVLQVLNATRLPSATILLSLSYMAKRIRQVSADRTSMPSERGVYSMLTVALILGSKFLDDNTFQNKSWAEVSNIATAELNQDERDWLVSFGHRLHNDPHCPDGFASWQERWKEYQRRPSPSSNALHPLDTNVRRQYPSAQPSYAAAPFAPKEYSPYAAYSSGPYSAAFAPADAWYSRPAMDRSPSTAPHSGPHTPEYYGNQALWAPMDDFSRRAQYGSYAPYPTSAYPGYNSGYSTPPHHAGWNAHGISCQCGNCLHAQVMQPKFPPIVCG